MKKRIWTRVLVALLALALVFTTACTGNGGKTTSAAASSAAASSAAASSAADTSAAPADSSAAASTAPASGDAPHIVWYANNGLCTDNDMVMAALSEYILDKINVDVDIQNMASSDYTEKIPVMLNAGTEMDMIICNASFNNPIADMVKINALTPVTQYVDTLLADTKAVLPDNIWKDATYKGEIWGVPLYKNRVRNYDFLYNKDMAEAMGEGEYMASLTWDFYPDLMEKLYPVKDKLAESGVASAPYLTTLGGPNAPRCFAAIDILQGDNNKKAYASINIDGEAGCPSQASGTVYNVYGTEEFREWCHLAYQWVEDGMIPSDDTKNIDPDNAFRTNGELFSWSSSGLTSIDPHSFSNDYETVLIRSSKAIGLSNASNGVYCVPASSKNVEAALKLMNLINSDGYLATCMRYGIEGTHWKYDTDGQVTIEFEGSRNADASNRGYYYWYGVFWGNLFIVSPAKQSAESTFVQDLYNLNEVGSTVSKYYGFIFDIADVTEQVAGIDNAVAQYIDQCGNGRLGSLDEIDKTLDEFNAAMEANGLADVIASAQTQLEAYATENGIK